MSTRPAGDSHTCVIEDVLRGGHLAALLVHVNPGFAPLLRINPDVVSPSQRPAVLAWADSLIRERRRSGMLRAIDLRRESDGAKA